MVEVEPEVQAILPVLVDIVMAALVLHHQLTQVVIQEKPVVPVALQEAAEAEESFM